MTSSAAPEPHRQKARENLLLADVIEKPLCRRPHRHRAAKPDIAINPQNLFTAQALDPQYNRIAAIS